MRIKTTSLIFASISAICLSVIGSVSQLKKALADGDSRDSSLMAGYPLVSSGVTSYGNYMSHYYDNLTRNFGMNYDSSCGYVALGMLLTYYDSSFDSNMVSSSYDILPSDDSYNLIERRNSPGALHDDFATTGFYNIYGHDFPGANLYLTYCYLKAGSSLHAKLITIGGQLGYVSSGVYYGGFVTTLNQRISVLNYYLQNIVGLSTNDYSISSGSYEYTYYTPAYDAMISSIRNHIDNGRPVLLGIKNSQYGSQGHAVIAYDYTSNSKLPNDYTFYCHPGLSSSGYSTHMTIDEMGYSIIHNYMAVEFNYSGSPGANYIVTSPGGSQAYPYNSYLLNWQSY